MSIIEKNDDFTVTKGINNLAVLGPHLQGDTIVAKNNLAVLDPYLRGDTIVGNNNLAVLDPYLRGDTIVGNKISMLQVAQDIQVIVEKLAQKYPATNRVEKNRFADEVIERIDNDPSLQQRLIEANEKETITFLSQNIQHPANSFIIAAIEDWLIARKSVG
jgi:hypothetical protein